MTLSPAAIRDLFFGLGFAVLLLSGLSLGRDYLVPIAVAVLVWFLINALSESMQRVAPRAPGWLTTILSVMVLFAVILFIAQIIVRNVGALGAGIEDVDGVLLQSMERLLARVGLAQRIDLDALWNGVRVEALFTGAFNAARMFAGDVTLVFLYVLFLLLDQRFYSVKLRALVPDPMRRAALEATLRHIADTTRAYLFLMSLISAGVGVATWLICLAFGVPGPGFWGFLAFALNFIPTIGSILGVAIPAVYGLLTVESDQAIVGLLLSLAALQFVAGEVVLPRVMGHRLNLSSFIIMLSLVVWGAMWGPAGMFLAIPIMVILMIVFSEFPSTRPIAIALSREGTVAERPVF